MQYRTHLKAFFIGASLIGSAIAGSNSYAIDGVQPYSQRFDIDYKGISVGQGVMQVSKQEIDSGLWAYEVNVDAKSTGLAKLIGGTMTIDDAAIGRWEAGNWRPDRFEHNEIKGDESKTESIYFNWAKNSLTWNKNGHVKNFALKPNTLDYGSAFVVLQSMASEGCITKQFNQVNKRGVIPVTIKCEGAETVSGIPSFKFTAINGDEGFTAWMNQSGKNELVRFTARKDGKNNITLSR